MLDYRQKPASVNTFYTPYLASKFPCLLDFAAAAFQLCAHEWHKDGCLSVNSAFALTDRKRGPIVSCTSGQKPGKFVHFVKTNNKQTLLFQSHVLYLRHNIQEIHFPDRKLIFTTQYQNSGLFHGREQSFQIQGLFPFSRVCGNPVYCLNKSAFYYFTKHIVTTVFYSVNLWVCSVAS